MTMSTEFKKASRELSAAMIKGAPYHTQGKDTLIAAIKESFACGFGAMETPLIMGLMNYYALSSEDAYEVAETFWAKYMEEHLARL